MAKSEGKAKMVKPPPTPKQPKPWDRRPFPEIPTMVEADIYSAVGVALTEWERFEAQAGNLFLEITRPIERVALLRAYGSIVTFSGRLEMIDAAMEAHLNMRPDDILAAAYRQFWDEAKGFSPRRNEIAHGVCFPSWHEISADENDRGYLLFPSDYATNKHELIGVHEWGHSELPVYGYGADDIRYYADRFSRLANHAKAVGALVRANCLRPVTLTPYEQGPLPVAER